ncbi:MAG TPA: extracellular solute-binding protein [Spirochaetia bacterium]|nr:extracellular solute-binding protein [Spirochaetia bacterium]
MTKRFWTTVAVGLLLASFSLPLWAGGKQEPASGPQDQTGGVTTLRVWKFGSPQNEREYMLSQIKIFESKNPSIKIDWAYQNYPERRTKVISAKQAGNLPDILLSDGQSIPEYVSLGVIRPLDEIDASMVEKWKPRFVPAGWETGVYDGHVYAVSPFVDMAPMLAYNTEMFKSAGIVDGAGNARPPKNWNELLSIAQKMNANGVSGISLPASKAPNDLEIFVGVAYRNGARWISDGKSHVNGPGFVDTLDLYQKLTKFAQPGYSDTNFRQAMELFFQKKAAMAITMSFAPILRQSLGAPADFPYKIASFPQRDSVSGQFQKANFIMTPTVANMITSSSKSVKQDMAYIDFWMTPEAQQGWNGSVVEGRIPIMKSNLESAPFAKEYPDLAAEYRKGTLFEGALAMPGFAGLSEAEAKLTDAFQEVLLGGSSAKAALDQVQPQIQQVFDSANKSK